ncbi:hypothetical protein PMAYCL1PPCAC_16480 [Pristionchus mayeri]|uniref:F-box domain-containing protein n=1 Tax=Pristionchus mayeri TaxID=1317129 RepID=A0AAN5CL16_9BILA|nr:hypothetical protein PMAYCL1PPCAC_16480 [Pristionchus mayeri]
MPTSKLPTELWQHILSFSDHPTMCALSKVCHKFAEIVVERNEFVLGKCRIQGVTLPSDELLSLSFAHPQFPLDIPMWMTHNPFGARIYPRLASVRGYDVDEKDGKMQFATSSTQSGVAERRVIDLSTEHESIGIPKWIIDGVRPQVTVTGLLQRRDGSAVGPRVTATMGVWRLDGIQNDHTFLSKEPIRTDLCTLESGADRRVMQVDIDPTAISRGHTAVGGSDGLRVVLNSNCDVRFSDVGIHFELPDKVPPAFPAWLAESRELRESRATTAGTARLEGLFGL